MQLILAILVGKLIFFFVRFFKIGGGSAAPGYYALKIDPNLVTKLCKSIPQQIVISGTNGKTTTARLLYQFLKGQQLKVIRNGTGSNLERGIASALISKYSLNGLSDIDIALWELDEAAFTKVFAKIKPQQVIFLNAFRDQLDRYGEVDSIVKNWQSALEQAAWPLQLIINNADNNTAFLSTLTQKHPNIKTLSFEIADHHPYQEPIIGQTFTKPKATYVAKIVQNNGLKGIKFEVSEQGKKLVIIDLPIPGIYHVYNFLAALVVYQQLNLPVNSLESHITQYTPAFGRVEKLTIGKLECYIFLIKNPAGTDAVFETIKPELRRDDTILLALNDNFADGTDVSWIWDAPFEKLLSAENKNTPQLVCSGKRAYDLAVRLKYAGVDPERIIIKEYLENAFSHATKNTEGRLFVLPTYTALLHLQGLLTKMGAKQHYWKEN